MGAGEDEGEAIKVSLRVKPFLPADIEMTKKAGFNAKSVFTLEGNTCVIKGGSAGKEEEYDFEFDSCFERPLGDKTAQRDIYDQVAAPFIDAIMSGFSCCIFAYGQTGSGKTFSMEGKDICDLEKVVKDMRKTTGMDTAGLIPKLKELDYLGIIPRSALDLQEKLTDIKNKSASAHVQVEASYVELYNENFSNLFDKSNKGTTRIKYNGKKKEYELQCDKEKMDPDEVFDKLMHMISVGNANAAVAATAMNPSSSRSHRIFKLDVEVMDKRANLFLVDLAGSESISKTKATGAQAVEGTAINKSLGALTTVLKKLSEGVNPKNIPFSDSQLTKILQPGLQGNCKTLIVICCSPSPMNFAETLTTLRFGKRAKKIVKKVTAESRGGDLAKRLMEKEEECKALRQIIGELCDELALWQKGETVPEKDRQDALKIKDSVTLADQLLAKTEAGNKGPGGGGGPAAMDVGAGGGGEMAGTAESKEMAKQLKAAQDEIEELKQQLQENAKSAKGKAGTESDMKTELDTRIANADKMQDQNRELQEELRQTRSDLMAAHSQIKTESDKILNLLRPLAQDFKVEVKGNFGAEYDNDGSPDGSDADDDDEDIPGAEDDDGKIPGIDEADRTRKMEEISQLTMGIQGKAQQLLSQQDRFGDAENRNYVLGKEVANLSSKMQEMRNEKLILKTRTEEFKEQLECLKEESNAMQQLQSDFEANKQELDDYKKKVETIDELMQTKGIDKMDAMRLLQRLDQVMAERIIDKRKLFLRELQAMRADLNLCRKDLITEKSRRVQMEAIVKNTEEARGHLYLMHNFYKDKLARTVQQKNLRMQLQESIHEMRQKVDLDLRDLNLFREALIRDLQSKLNDPWSKRSTHMRYVKVLNEVVLQLSVSNTSIINEREQQDAQVRGLKTLIAKLEGSLRNAKKELNQNKSKFDAIYARAAKGDKTLRKNAKK